MVVFTCNYCGDSIKKPSIAKHSCRGPYNLTCVDCMKDFRGNEYEAHIKCLTENERYSAKGYVAPLSSNKGERKQQSWFEAVQNILNSTNNLRDDERELLTVLSAHENLPRKRTKFFNFVQNAHRTYARRTELVERTWNIIEEAGKSALNNTKNDLEPSDKVETNGKNEDQNGPEKVIKDKKRKKDKTCTEENGVENNEPEQKRGKIETNGINEVQNGPEKVRKDKKQKKDKTATEENGMDDNKPAETRGNIEPSENENSDKNNILNNIITGQGGTISLYRLNQKLVEYCDAEAGDGDKMKLLKKISKKVDIILENGVITMNVEKLNK